MIYIGIDGDNVGNIMERYIIENDEENVRKVSFNIENDIETLTRHLSDRGFKIIISAGDNILCRGESINKNDLKEMLRELSNCCSFSVGIASTMKDTYLALKYAKVIGKNAIVDYENEKFQVFEL